MNPKLEENHSHLLRLKRGQRGEAWVVLQGLLLLGFILLPPRPIMKLSLMADWVRYGIWALTLIFGLTALIFIVKGLIDLGNNLTPFPYPKENGKLIKTGIYSVVRHPLSWCAFLSCLKSSRVAPLYSGLIFAALGWAIFQLSLSHFIGTVVLFVFLDLKSKQEENWLKQKYSEYIEYCSQVNQLIPGIY